MPSDRDFVEATRLAAGLRAAARGDPFAVYLERRGAGLKSEAPQMLDGFLAVMTVWPTTPAWSRPGPACAGGAARRAARTSFPPSRGAAVHPDGGSPIICP